MKTTTLIRASVLAIVTAFFVFAGTTSSSADPYHHNHAAWSHDSHGYWDNHYAYHHYSYYHGHQGYWRPNDNGVRVWINL